MKPAALAVRLSCVRYCWPAGSFVKQKSVCIALSDPPLEGAIEAQNHCKLEKMPLSPILLNEPLFLFLFF